MTNVTAPINGKVVKLSDYKGKVVFLNFWATYCQPCIAEMPSMEALKEKFKDRKFEMLAISVDTDWKPVKEFYAQYKLSMHSFLDPGQQVARDVYKVTGIPETFLIDANGYVVKHTWGANWSDPRLVSTVESLIQEQEARQQASIQ